jgi:hypothetical protein
VDNASLILQTLDGHLKHPARLIRYGRAAIQLGFADPPGDVAESKDVDAIIPLGDLDELSADEAFWDAQEATNTELRPKGLYTRICSAPTKSSSAANGSATSSRSPTRPRAGYGCSAPPPSI